MEEERNGKERKKAIQEWNERAWNSPSFGERIKKGIIYEKFLSDGTVLFVPPKETVTKSSKLIDLLEWSETRSQKKRKKDMKNGMKEKETKKKRNEKERKEMMEENERQKNKVKKKE